MTIDGGKAAILARVRRALGRSDAETAEPPDVRERLTAPRPNTIPARSRLQQPQLAELFVAMAEQAQATVERLQAPAQVPAAVAALCRQQGVAPACVLGPDSALAELAWAEAGLEVARRPARSGDGLALASARAGIAETGTLVLCSGPANPVTSNFLPDRQVVVLRQQDIVGAAEDLWALLREQDGTLPRTVNWITGPSRSADIEMTMVNGAHGPIALHILLLS